jgi:hypothetical protein
MHAPPVLTVVAVDAGHATLLSSALHVVKLPRALLPPGDLPHGALVRVCTERALDAEAQYVVAL